MTLDKIIQKLKIETINEENYQIFFDFIINELNLSILKYDFYTNNIEELKNILIFVGKYQRMFEFRTSILTHEEHGREFCFSKTRHFDDEIPKWKLNKKIKKIKC